MKLLIDGYNLVRYVTRGPAKRSDIESILARLRRYKRAAGHEIVVVFDGGDSTYKYQQDYYGLCLWYSGVSETADDVILRLLPTYNVDEVVLISDDRQLNYAAQECDIVSVSPKIFYACMQEREDQTSYRVLERNNDVIKTSPEDNDELDMLMHIGSGDVRPKQETNSNKDVIFKREKSTKMERRLQLVMRKL